ncbi:MAG: peptidylprolyl isomerase [candidate division Zixibacteria bacterium]|nr:peptidylprolyl isomerase [candidate division Zixibacteria bacterium]
MQQIRLPSDRASASHRQRTADGIPLDDGTWESLLKLAQELKDSLDNGASFAELAKEYSNDDDTRRTEGRLGWYAYLNLPPEFQGVISPETAVGSIIGPLQSQFGLHLVKALEKQEESKISLENHYDEIREFARRRKTDRLIEEWVEQRKKDTYVEIRSINDF